MPASGHVVSNTLGELPGEPPAIRSLHDCKTKTEATYGTTCENEETAG